MIRPIKQSDRELFLKYAYDFYHSEAVLHPVPKEYCEATFDELIASDRYLEGFILEQENKPIGYALLSKSFSPEVGGPIIWIEEIYLVPAARGMGFGKSFFAFLQEHYGSNTKRFRLEAEPDNKKAIALYQQLGYHPLPYLQMILDK